MIRNTLQRVAMVFILTLVCAMAGGDPVVDHARKVMDIPNSLEKCYFWLDAGRVLVLEPTGVDRRYRAVVMSVQTGKAEPLVSFNRRFSERLLGMVVLNQPQRIGNTMTRVDRLVAPPTVVLSPDGKWLLWGSWDIEKRQTDWIAAALDGSKYFVWPNCDDSWGLWYPDSKSWVGVVPDHQDPARDWGYVRVVVHALGKARPLREADLVGKVPGPMPPVGFLPGRRLLLRAPPGPDVSPKPHLFVIPDDQKAPKVEAFQVKFPYDHRAIGEVTIIEHGRRLAWDVYHMTAEQNGALEIGFWTSRIDGKEMRPVFTYDVRDTPPGAWEPYSAPDPQSLQTTPDGAGISFLYRNALYIMPISASPGDARSASHLGSWLVLLIVAVLVAGGVAALRRASRP